VPLPLHAQWGDGAGAQPFAVFIRQRIQQVFDQAREPCLDPSSMIIERCVEQGARGRPVGRDVGVGHHQLLKRVIRRHQRVEGKQLLQRDAGFGRQRRLQHMGFQPYRTGGHDPVRVQAAGRQVRRTLCPQRLVHPRRGQRARRDLEPVRRRCAQLTQVQSLLLQCVLQDVQRGIGLGRRGRVQPTQVRQPAVRGSVMQRWSQHRARPQGVHLVLVTGMGSGTCKLRCKQAHVIEVDACAGTGLQRLQQFHAVQERGALQ